MHTGKPTRTTSRHKVGGECSFDVKIANDMYRTQVVRISATEPGVTEEQLDELKGEWLNTKDEDGRVYPYPGLSSGPDDPYFRIQAYDNWPLIGWLEWIGGEDEYQCYIGLDDRNIVNILDFAQLLWCDQKCTDIRNKIAFHCEKYVDWMKSAKLANKNAHTAEAKAKAKAKAKQDASSAEAQATKEKHKSRIYLSFARKILAHITFLANSNTYVYNYIKTRIQDRKRKTQQREATERLQDIILADEPLEDSIDELIQKLDAL